MSGQTTNYNTTNNYNSKSDDLGRNNVQDAGGDGQYKKPKSLIDAVSEIQQYHALESNLDDPIPEEFFTYKQQFDFYGIGFKSAFIEGMIFLMIVPFAEALYPSFKEYFFGQGLTSNEMITIYMASYTPVLIMTIFLAAMSKYNSGVLTKKAISSLIWGRSTAFILKGIIAFVVWMIVIAIAESSPQLVYQISDYSLWVFEVMYENDLTPEHIYYYFYNAGLPAINSTAKHVLFTMAFLSVLPFITLYGRHWTRGKTAKTLAQQFEEY